MPAKKPPKPPQGAYPPPPAGYGVYPPPPPAGYPGYPGAYPPPPPPAPPKPARKKKQSPTTKLKRKIASVTGIPTTASGRKKKAERVVANFLIEQLDKIKKK